MIRVLADLSRKRELLRARSAAQREAIGQVVRPGALRVAAAESLLAGVAQVLALAARLAPLYSMLRRP
jgi:hypothetical protein